MRLKSLIALPSLLILLLSWPLLISCFAQERSGQASLSVKRHIQSKGPFPVAGDYVFYDIQIKNVGLSAVASRSLWVNFVPVHSNMVLTTAGTSSKFEVPSLAPGASVQLHLGPFKLHTAGEYALYVGIVNSSGNEKGSNDIEINIDPQVPVDSVIALEPAVAGMIPVGMGVALAGVILLTWMLYLRKNKRRG
jgi:hypothetical protein